MTKLIHVLGSDIPHHNLTVLDFFNSHLAAELPAHTVHHFMVVAKHDTALSAFSLLNIDIYSDKKHLAKAVIARARDRQTRFFLHGQFNPFVWLAILLGKLKPQQVYWHVWGADLYEVSTDWRFRGLYWLRRLAQHRVAHVFATRGDIQCYKQRHPDVPATLLYFPTKMGFSAEKLKLPITVAERLTILVGNSGDRSNRHLEALREIHRQFGDQVHLIIPLGYPADNGQYIAEIRAKASNLFPPENVQLITQPMPFDDYLGLLADCSLAYFIFPRQQAVGTLCLLMQFGIPFVLNKKNSFCLDLQEQKVPVLYYKDPIDAALVQATHHQLAMLDKSQIPFFYPNYVAGWRTVLNQARGEPT